MGKEKRQRLFAFLTVVLLLFPTLLPAQTDNFRGISWGEDLYNLRGMTLLSNTEPGVKAYTRDGEIKKIGEFEVKHIIYCFYKNKFYASFIIFIGYPAFSYFKKSLELKYGSPGQPNRYIETYLFGGGNLLVMLSLNTISIEGRIDYLYKPISDKKDRDRTESAVKAKDAL